MKQEQHIQTMYSRHSNQTRSEYRARLQVSVDCVRFLLRQGLAFRAMMNLKSQVTEVTF